jgi:hypothetical protein
MTFTQFFSFHIRLYEKKGQSLLMQAVNRFPKRTPFMKRPLNLSSYFLNKSSSLFTQASPLLFSN